MNQKVLIALVIIVVVGILIGLELSGIRISSTGEVTAGRPSLVLLYSDGTELSPDNVILDGESQGSKSEIILSGIDIGEHDIVIIVKGIRYDKSFSYNGESLTLILEEPVKTSILSLSSANNNPLEGIKVYSDAEYKCKTNSDGVCDFYEKPGKHTIKLQGTGTFKEEIKTISKDSNSFSFYLERKFSVKIKVLDKDTDTPIKDAEIEVDGIIKGKTNFDGELTVLDLKEGSHSFEAEYKEVSEKEVININKDNQMITIHLVIPKTVTIELKDAETQRSINGMTIFLESLTKTYRSGLPTDDNGKTNIDDVLPGDYQIRLEGALGTIKPSKLITVLGTTSYLTETVDMPNPKFTGSLSCEIYYNTKKCGLEEAGYCTIKVKNNDYDKAIMSQDTSVILLVYINGTLVDKDLVDFGKIPPGETEIKYSTLCGFQWLKEETVAGVIFEEWKYTPENDKNVGEISAPLSQIGKWAKDAGDAMVAYCKANPAECLKVIAGVIKGFI